MFAYETWSYMYRKYRDLWRNRVEGSDLRLGKWGVVGKFTSLSPVKEERETSGDFHIVFRAYSFHTRNLYLSNFDIMQRKKGVTGLDFSGDLLLCMFLTYF